MTRLQYGIFSALVFLSLSACVAQTHRIDSLKTALAGKTGKERIDALFAVANALENVYPGQSLQYSAEGIKLATELGDSGATATFYSSSGYCYGMLGDFPQSLKYGFLSLEICRRIGDAKREARAHSTIGITYAYLGEYSRALEHHLEALRIREELGGIEMYTTLNNIGIVYHNIGNYDKAIEYYKRALEGERSASDTSRYIRRQLNIGYSEYKRGRIGEAKKYYEEALRLSKHTKYSNGLAYGHYLYGILKSDAKNYSEAIADLRQSQAYYGAMGQKAGTIQVLNALGSALSKSGNTREAIRDLVEAAALADQINMPKYLIVSYETLYSIYEKTGPESIAFKYYKLYSAAKDSLANSTQSNKIAELSVNFAMLKKEREIDLLKKEKTIGELQLAGERYQSTLLGVGIVSLSIVLIVLYWHTHNTKRSKKDVELNNLALQRLNRELQEKISEVKTLNRLLPICANCKKIRDDKGYWEQLEGYISRHSEATFSHGICPDCATKLYPQYQKRKDLQPESDPAGDQS